MAGKAYDRVRFEGRTFNRRTVEFIKQVRTIYYLIGGTGRVTISQGSYNRGVSESANTHNGGGAIDWDLEKETSKNCALLQRANRICGGASWDRPTLPGKWSRHNHTIVIGDREMDDSARRQVQDYYAGLNGLANHGRDTSWRPSVIPVFSYPLQTVDLSIIRNEAKKRSRWVESINVKRYQRALNAKTGAGLKVDGIFGPRTRAANARFERQVGGDGNGIPGLFGTTLLGAARFNVKP